MQTVKWDSYNKMNISILFVASLPIVYMLHDFEEIIGMKPLAKSNEKYLYKKFPRLASKLVPHLKSTSTEGFALCVAILFTIISFVTISALYTGFYRIWMGIFMVFSIHIVVHIIQWIVFRKYIPAIITSLLCIPYCIFGIIYINDTFALCDIFAYSILVLVVSIILLYVGHRYLAKLI